MDKIYQEHAKTVYAFLMLRCHNSDLAEELTQETFYQAMKSIDRFDGKAAMNTWLCAIAKNVYRKYIEKHKENELIEDQIISSQAIEKEVTNKILVEKMLKNIHRLDEPLREIVYLRLLGDLSFRSIGEIFEKSENWARVNYYRAKQKLLKEMKTYEK